MAAQATRMLLVASLVLLTACSNDIVYDYSVDVNPSEWTPTDTLFFPIRVDKPSNRFHPLELLCPYCLTLTVRYESCYPAQTLHLHIQMDDTKPVAIPLGDESGFPDGQPVGSLYMKSYEVNNMLFAFRDSGDYCMKIWTDSLAESVVSVTATLE